MFTLLCLCLYLITTRRATATKFSPETNQAQRKKKKGETFATAQEKGDSGIGHEKATTLRATGAEEVVHLLAEGAGGEHLGDEVDVAA
jgi:hypothetical protein